MAHNIDNWLSEARNDLSFFSKDQVFADSLEGEGYFGRSARTSALREMTRMAQEHSSLEAIFLVSLDAEFIISPFAGGPEVIDILEDEALFSAAREGRSTISDPVKIDAISTRPMIFAATPVFPQSGEILGAMIGRISIETLSSRYIESADSLRNGITFVLTSQGHLLASYQMDLNPSADDVVYQNALAMAADMSGASPWQIFSRELHDPDYRGLETAVHFKEINAVLVNTTSLDKAFLPVFRMGRFLTVTWVVLIIIVCSTLIILFRTIVQKPLEALSIAFERVASGNYATRIRGDMGRDEVGRLTQAFNTMAEELEAGVNELKEEISRHQASRRALAESEQRYRQLFSEMSAGFAVLDVLFDKDQHPTDCIFLEVNSRFTSNTGLKPEKVIGHRTSE
ncbi:MAG: cache domain-containing protein, partial [Candidatus Sumerlaeota bacterium]